VLAALSIGAITPSASAMGAGILRRGDDASLEDASAKATELFQQSEQSNKQKQFKSGWQQDFDETTGGNSLQQVSTKLDVWIDGALIMENFRQVKFSTLTTRLGSGRGILPHYSRRGRWRKLTAGIGGWVWGSDV
jgi:hypothetical protein